MRFLLSCLALWLWTGAASATSVHVFAAASLKNALDELVATYHDQQPASDVRVTLAGSSTLARQIAAGAPAHIFISANTEWMDLLAHQGKLVESSRIGLLQNRLVLISPESGLPIDLQDADALPKALGKRRVAVALVDAVPAGIYAKEALTTLGHWAVLEDRLAQADNVQAALNLVVRGEAPLGIVYATDAHAEPRVTVRGIFPQNSHALIQYPAALIKGAKPTSSEAQGFYRFLQSQEAQKVYQSHGFLLPGGDV